MRPAQVDGADASGFVDPAASGTFYCPLGCKYSQGKVEYNANTVQYLSWWGSTASGTCDPSNDVQRWQLQGNAVYNDANGAKVYGYTSGVWKTNCEIVNNNQPPWAWVVAPNVSWPSNASAHFWWMYQQPDGRLWFDYLRLDF